MMRFYRSSAVFLTIAFANPSAADLAPTDVWNDWKSLVAAFGLEITGEESTTGDVLSVADAAITGTLFDEGMRIEIAMGDLRFEGRADGSVGILLPPEISGTTTVEFTDDEAVTVQTSGRHEDLVFSASGVPAEIVYTYAASSLRGESTASAAGSGIDLPAQTTAYALEDVSGESTVRLTDMRRTTATFAAALMSYSTRTSTEGTPVSANSDYALTDLTATSESTVPLVTLQAADLGALIAAGLTARSELTSTSTRFSQSMSGEVAGDFTGSTGPGRMTIGLGQEGVEYAGSQQNVEVDGTLSVMPVPVAFAAERMEFGLETPLLPSDAADDFGLAVALEGVTMADSLWSLFDPQAQLPRDPARVIVDLSGMGRLVISPFDPPAPAVLNAPGFAPVEFETLAINRLEIALAGAELGGEGKFEFEEAPDNTGPALPVGTMNFVLSGANGLIDKLVAMGLLPEEQAMGARMMMGLLGTPGDAPDTLTSTIELREGMQVFANGQRIR